MSVCSRCTDAVLLHQGYEVGLSEQLRWTRLSVRHLDSRGLELRALLVHWNHLAITKRSTGCIAHEQRPTGTTRNLFYGFRSSEAARLGR